MLPCTFTIFTTSVLTFYRSTVGRSRWYRHLARGEKSFILVHWFFQHELKQYQKYFFLFSEEHTRDLEGTRCICLQKNTDLEMCVCVLRATGALVQRVHARVLHVRTCTRATVTLYYTLYTVHVVHDMCVDSV